MFVLGASLRIVFSFLCFSPAEVSNLFYPKRSKKWPKRRVYDQAEHNGEENLELDARPCPLKRNFLSCIEVEGLELKALQICRLQLYKL